MKEQVRSILNQDEQGDHMKELEKQGEEQKKEIEELKKKLQQSKDNYY